VEEYQCQFLQLLCYYDDMTLLQQVHMFTIGLGKPLRMDVELATPFDLQSMMSLTRAYERRHTVS
jgi:hypothetical protein